MGGVVTVSETQMTGKELGSKTVSRSSRSPGASQRTLGNPRERAIFSRCPSEGSVGCPSALAPGVRLGSDLAPQKTMWRPCGRL